MPSTASILPVPVDQIAGMWPEVAPHVIKGLSAATDVTLQQLIDDLLAGVDRLWVALDGGRVRGAFVTSECDEENGDEQTTFLTVYALGGKHMRRWVNELEAAMIREAKARGCGSVRFCGREAWSRVLPSCRVVGHREGHAIFERDVQ